ncbi:M20/M25/M40 family metallo-hydrolase [Sphingobacterium hungaricum]|uniref:Carboxypeptidase Q n=1 Tax=Sphingobacterium hungaricum TaxID=2082723 RepID=A0A928UVI3_9SPHI|nr:M20/M25/M40 family metallo-hydrolase [Sphingobacterium hungaricum]MBE8713995.1 aminopeptidase [Sphingobacterium hungaricum]
MKNIILFIFLLPIFSLFAQDYTKAYNQIAKEVDKNSEAYSNLKLATETIGHRLTGSSNGAKAEEYAFEVLKSYGLDVRYQAFEVESWARKSLSLKMDNQPVKAVSLAHSPVSAELTAAVIDVGNGLKSDYERLGNSVQGKIVLAYLHILPGSEAALKNLHRSEKTALAAQYGAKGIIFINSVNGGVLLTGTASITGKLINIPAVCIGKEDGMAWKEKLKNSEIQAYIQMENSSELIQARNIVATIPGKSLANEKIVVGGHLDSWDLATGAIDNGIGSFAVMDMARTLKELHLKSDRTIEFVLFMGEEQGLLGSKAYVEQAKKDGQLNTIKYMLNFDMTNNPKGFSTSRVEMDALHASWGKLYSTIDTAFQSKNTQGAWLHSDHQPFMLAGIPIGGGGSAKLPNNAGLYYHSDQDNFNLVDEYGLKQTVKIGAVLAYSLANTKEIPAKQQNDDELVLFLEESNLKEELKISGDWKWN